MGGKRAGVAATVAVLMWAGFCLADTLVTTDGRWLEGRVVSRSSSTIVFEVYRLGTYTRMELNTDDVARIIPGPPPDSAKPAAAPTQRPALPPGLPHWNGEPPPPPLVAYTGPTYYLVPMNGMVGQIMTADVLNKSLADAAARKPTVVILVMDSGGGIIDEVSKMVDVIDKYKHQLRIVELNHTAISAAAITSLAVDNIYMTRSSVIGAATAYQLIAGLPQDIEEKFQSIWRASARAAADVGHHPSVLAEAMIDRNVPVYRGVKDGKPFATASATDGAVEIKPVGKLMILTADEAVNCGLASGIADDPAELGKLLGYPNWTECVGLATPLNKFWDTRIKTATKKIQDLYQRFESDMQEARANDPGSFRDYFADSQTRRLIPDSQQKWADRTDRCLRSLGHAISDLDQVEHMATDYPTMVDGPRIKELRGRIDAAKQHVAAQYEQ